MSSLLNVLMGVLGTGLMILLCNRFFTYVDETTLNSRAIYTAFVAILDNFYALTGTSDSISAAEQAEMDKLYSLLTPTALFNKLYSYLKCRGSWITETNNLTLAM